MFACLSQGALESGWCGSEIMRKHNAPFGVKWTGEGKFYETKTSEQDKNGNTYTITAKFRAYDTLYDGIYDYIKLITSGRYVGTLNCDYVQDVIKILKSNGYATDINYVNKVMGCYDTIVKVLR